MLRRSIIRSFSFVITLIGYLLLIGSAAGGAIFLMNIYDVIGAVIGFIFGGLAGMIIVTLLLGPLFYLTEIYDNLCDINENTAEALTRQPPQHAPTTTLEKAILPQTKKAPEPTTESALTPEPQRPASPPSETGSIRSIGDAKREQESGGRPN